MIVLLWAFTAFDLCVGLAALMHGLRLMAPEERARWRSKRLLTFATVIAGSMAPVALAGVGLAWMHYLDGRHDAVPIILSPIAWLLALGLVFAIVDFAEDGILGNARK